MKVSRRVQYAELKAHVEIDGAGLKPQWLLDHFLSGAVVGIALPSATMHAETDTDGRSALNARLALDIPALTVMRNDSHVELFATRSA